MPRYLAQGFYTSWEDMVFAMSEPFELSVAEIRSYIRQGVLSSTELMQSLLTRATALEDSLRVWVTLDQCGAIRTAGCRDTDLRCGLSLGHLHGVPLGVKDIFYTRGLKTTACSPIYADFVPQYDSTSVALLKNAGAVIMGKTVTTEFACADPSPTRNPWNFDHTPGGSSSGSAVGVAARIFPAAIGSQTAGSVIRPASYNGVVGMKPTFGLISRSGVIPVAWSLDTVGFFARTVEDTAIIFKVLARQEPMDGLSFNDIRDDCFKEVSPLTIPPRIGLVRQLYEKADRETRKHIEDLVCLFERAGATVDEATISIDLDDLLAAHGIIMATEVASFHEENFKVRQGDYGPNIRRLIETGTLVTAAEYVRAQRVRRLFVTAIQNTFRNFDVLLGPTTPSAAPRDLNTTGDPSFQAPWTTGGLPVITIPSGMSISGLPLGVQLISESFTEDRLLRVAQWCEQILNITLIPPPIF